LKSSSSDLSTITFYLLIKYNINLYGSPPWEG
jgi:hypothetical protein